MNARVPDRTGGHAEDGAGRWPEVFGGLPVKPFLSAGIIAETPNVTGEPQETAGQRLPEASSAFFSTVTGAAHDGDASQPAERSRNDFGAAAAFIFAAAMLIAYSVGFATMAGKSRTLPSVTRRDS